jgi:ribosomal protein S12
MPTIQQLVRKGRKVLVDKSKSPAFGFLSSKTRRLRESVYNYS